MPTGNFGDIYAGWKAKRMGLPIRNLYLATNENNVLADVWEKGIYRPRKNSEVIETDCARSLYF